MTKRKKQTRKQRMTWINSIQVFDPKQYPVDLGYADLPRGDLAVFVPTAYTNLFPIDWGKFLTSDAIYRTQDLPLLYSNPCKNMDCTVLDTAHGTYYVLQTRA